MEAMSSSVSFFESERAKKEKRKGLKVRHCERFVFLGFGIRIIRLAHFFIARKWISDCSIHQFFDLSGFDRDVFH